MADTGNAPELRPEDLRPENFVDWNTGEKPLAQYKWLDREEWRQPFEELLEAHVVDTCREAGVSPDELARAIGGHHTKVLWACAVEDSSTISPSDCSRRRVG